MKTKISKDFEPNSQTIALAMGRGMPIKDWLYHLLPEFRLYWVDRNIKRDSWQSTFWNHAKNEWERADKSRLYRKATDPLPSKPKPATHILHQAKKAIQKATKSKEERNAQADKWLSQLK